MSTDLTKAFHDWPHYPGSDERNLRCVRGDDGRLKIQVRVHCGLFQWEYEGRPDGRTPYGCPNLLDYYTSCIQKLERQHGDDLELDKQQIQEINQEITDYYQRRVLFFRLGEYDRARTDAEHSLALMDLLRDHATDPEVVAEHEQYRPAVLMDRTRAEAMSRCQHGAYMEAMQEIDRGVAEIAGFFRTHRRSDLIAQSLEVASLHELKHQLREAYDIPLSNQEVLDGLREEQAKAIADEDYERAARLRDEITRFETDGPAETL